MTTRAIAEQLFVTTKTIETHLGQIYPKLDIPRNGYLLNALTTETTPETSTCSAGNDALPPTRPPATRRDTRSQRSSSRMQTSPVQLVAKGGAARLSPPCKQ
jgi:hypothetical protein